MTRKKQQAANDKYLNSGPMQVEYSIKEILEGIHKNLEDIVGQMLSKANQKDLDLCEARVERLQAEVSAMPLLRKIEHEQMEKNRMEEAEVLRVRVASLETECAKAREVEKVEKTGKSNATKIRFLVIATTISALGFIVQTVILVGQYLNSLHAH